MLRYYQNEQLDAVLQNYIEGTTQQLIQAATGTGKTVLFSNLPQKIGHLLPGKMLVVVHREELVDQAIASIRHWTPSLKVGKEMAEHFADTDCDVIVSCVASIGREGATRMLRFGWDNIDKVIVDECHHGIATTYMSVFEAAGVLKPGSKKLLLGVTATPKRKNLTRAQKREITTLDDEDILSLKSVFKKIVHKYPIRKAIKDGWLVPIKGYKIKTGVDLSEVKSTAGDYAPEQLADAVNTPTRNQQCVKAWLDFAERRISIAFTVDIKHAKDLASEFCLAGVRAEAVWGEDPDRFDSYACDTCDARTALKEKEGKECRVRDCEGHYKFKEGKISHYRRGEIEVLCNCGVLIEGFDAWNVLCVIMAAPTKSSSKYTQEIGRGTRLEEGTGNLLEALKAGIFLRKKDLLVLDLVDNNKRCSLVTLPSLVGLNPEFDLRGESVTQAVEEIEALQEKHPTVNFIELTDLSKVKIFVESLDMFAEPYTEEVKEFSEMTWMATQDGSYVLSVPEKKSVTDNKEYWNYLHEKLHITPTALDEFELSITTTNSSTDRTLGTFSTLKEAFTTADQVIKDCRADRVTLMQRTAGWRGGTASDASKKYLKRLVKKQAFIYCVCPVGPNCSGVAGTICGSCKQQQMSAGQVSLAINRFKNKI